MICILVLKHVFYLQVLFPESSIFPRVQARADYLLHLCIKSILMVFLRRHQNTALLSRLTV